MLFGLAQGGLMAAVGTSLALAALAVIVLAWRQLSPRPIDPRNRPSPLNDLEKAVVVLRDGVARDLAENAPGYPSRMGEWIIGILGEVSTMQPDESRKMREQRFGCRWIQRTRVDERKPGQVIVEVELAYVRHDPTEWKLSLVVRDKPAPQIFVDQCLWEGRMRRA